MNRIDQIFSDLRARGGKALMPFVTAGDGGLETTGQVLAAMQAGGASICEVGIPFSDPVADGPVIQASMMRALEAGTTVEQVFEKIASLRSSLSVGLVAMVSYSIVYRLGLERFVSEAKAAGFDGFIFPDLPLGEAGDARAAAREAGLILSMLVAPTTPIERAKEIAAASSGFVYVVARSGVTGERAALAEDLPGRLAALRTVTDAPLAVGFGVSSAQQVGQIVQTADAAIVASALIRRMQEVVEQGGDPVQEAERFTRDLATGLVGSAGRV
ncbi:MAG: tryptophan synthase subunit alpha [Planctomycetota bacterium]